MICPSLSLLIAVGNSSVVISGILSRLFGIFVVHVCVAVVAVIIHFMFRVVFRVVLVKSFLEVTKDVGNSFSRCDAFAFVVSFFCDEYLLLC